jgi:hypothetical protein
MTWNDTRTCGKKAEILAESNHRDDHDDRSRRPGGDETKAKDAESRRCDCVQQNP